MFRSRIELFDVLCEVGIPRIEDHVAMIGEEIVGQRAAVAVDEMAADAECRRALPDTPLLELLNAAPSSFGS